MWHGLSVYCVLYNISCISIVTTEQCDLYSCSVVSHETCVVYNICNSVPRGTTYLARNLPHPATVPAEPLMSVYNYVSGHNVISCYFSVYTVLEIGMTVYLIWSLLRS